MENIGTAANSALTHSSEVSRSPAVSESKRAAIQIQVRRLISHFPTNRTEEDWAVVVLDYVELLSPFELERIAAAVSEHIRTGEFFPKVSELINRCQPKFKSPPPKNVLNDTKQLEYEGPDLETRKRGVAHWERIKAQMIEAVEERADKPKPWREGGSDEFSKLVG